MWCIYSSNSHIHLLSVSVLSSSSVHSMLTDFTRELCIMQMIDTDSHLIPTYNVTLHCSQTSEKNILTHLSIIFLMPTINSVQGTIEAVTA